MTRIHLLTALVLAGAAASPARERDGASAPNPYLGYSRPDLAGASPRGAASTPVQGCPGACAELRWESRKVPIRGFEGAAAGVVGDRVYMVEASELLIYDTAADLWSFGPPPPTNRQEGAGASLGGRVYVIGGRSSGSVTDSVESFDPAAGTWRAEPSLAVARAGHAAVVLDGLIHVIGGRNSSVPHSGAPLGSHEVFDPVAATWSNRTPLLKPVGDCYAAVALGGRIYVFGGWDGAGVVADTQAYDPAAGAWFFVAPMPTARSNAIAGVLGQSVAVVGGFIDPFFGLNNLDVVEVYDPATDSWCTGPRKPQPASEMAAGGPVVGDGLYALGSGAFGVQLAISEVLLLEDLDSAPPVITCPADLVLECPADAADVDSWRGTVSASDDCSDPVIVSELLTHEPGCGGSYVDTYRFTATDLSGQTASCEARVVVIDSGAPTLTGVPADATVECDAVPPPAIPTASDSCDPQPAIVFTETTVPGTCPQTYTIERRWVASDACGNSTEAVQTITVVDTQPPVLGGVPADATVECDAVPPPASPTASDSCDLQPAIVFTETIVPGVCPQAYTIERRWVASDACGNSVEALQTIAVVDTQAPVISGVPADETVECDAVPGPASPTASDNCDPQPSLTLSETITPGSCVDAYTLLRTWRATDACGNVAEDSQTISVVDTTAPVPAGLLEPIPPAVPTSPASPHSPRSAASACSAPASGAFRVRCSATDNCDPAPALQARLIVTWHEVPEPGVCVERVEAVSVSCDEVVEVELLSRVCPARRPRQPRRPASVNSDGVQVVSGESVVLEVEATDRCGNDASDRFDPAEEPAPGCEVMLPDGTCCPAVGRPEDPPCPLPLCGG